MSDWGPSPHRTALSARQRQRDWSQPGELGRFTGSQRRWNKVISYDMRFWRQQRQLVGRDCKCVTCRPRGEYSGGHAVLCVCVNGLCHTTCYTLQSILWLKLHRFDLLYIRYRPRSRGDNTFGSVRVCACVCPSVCLWALSCLNRLIFELDFWHEGRPWPWLAWDCRSRSNSENCLSSPVWTSGAEQVDIRTRLAEFSQW